MIESPLQQNNFFKLWLLIHFDIKLVTNGLKLSYLGKIAVAGVHFKINNTSMKEQSLVAKKVSTQSLSRNNFR